MVYEKLNSSSRVAIARAGARQHLNFNFIFRHAVYATPKPPSAAQTTGAYTHGHDKWPDRHPFRGAATPAAQQTLTQMAGFLANKQAGALTTRAITWFIKRYRVNMQEAAYPEPSHYASFNDFFTRPLLDGARPLAGPAC